MRSSDESSQQLGKSQGADIELQKFPEAKGSAQTETKEALVASEKRLRSLIDQTTDAVFCYEYTPPIPFNLPIDEQMSQLYNGVLADCNLVCAKSYGAHGVEEVIGRKLIDLFGTNIGSLDKLFRLFIESGFKVTDGEGIEHLPDGSQRFFLNNGHGVIENGMLLRIWGTFRDITERKQEDKQREMLQEELQSSEDKYRNLFDTMAQGVVYQDSTGKIISANPSAEKMLGLTLDQMLGRTSVDPRWRAIHEDGSDFPGDTHPAMVALRTNEPVTGVVMGIYSPKEETYRWILVNSVPRCRSGEPKPCEVYSTFSDITELKQSEEEKTLLAEQLQTLFASSSDFLYFKDVDRRFVQASSAFCDLFSCSLEDIIGKRDEDLFPAELAKDTIADDRSVIETGKSIINREEGGGDLPWVMTSKIPWYNKKGEIVGLFGISRDITERKKSEEERLSLEKKILHAQKLESLGVLSGGIAHDFNNLLVGLLGNVDLALMDSASNSAIRPRIQDIQTASIRLAEMTEQMLAYAGKGSFTVEPLNLSSMVKEMVQLLNISISKKVVLRCDFAPNLPTILGNVNQIRQVAMNLITNASESYGENNGIVTLCTCVLDASLTDLSDYYPLDDQPAGESVLLEVSDTGCGMDIETRERLFDPFFSTKFAGRGLGMAAVLGIVRSHGGAIKVRSEPQQGTTIKVLFPIAEKNFLIESDSSSSDNREIHGQGLVLIVDDDKTVLSTCRLMLERMGYDVIIATDGAGGVKQVREHGNKLFCVLLDLTMPHMDGLAAFSEIHRIRPNLPVILCSGFDQQEATKQFKGKGLTDFLQKPYRYQGLAEKLREIYEQCGIEGDQISDKAPQ